MKDDFYLYFVPIYEIHNNSALYYNCMHSFKDCIDTIPTKQVLLNCQMSKRYFWPRYEILSIKQKGKSFVYSQGSAEAQAI